MEIFNSKMITSIIMAVIAIVVLFLIDRIVKRLKKTDAAKDSVSAKAIITAIGRIIKMVFALIVIFIIFEINGINLTSIIASLGLAGAVAALAAQDLMKDLLSGIYISGEKMYAPGDAIRYNEQDGVVLDFNLRSTKVRLLENDHIMYISNRNIYDVIVLSHDNYIDLPLPYEVSPEKSKELMEDMVRKIATFDLVESVQYLGVQKLDSSAVMHRILYSSEVVNRGIVARQIRQALLELLSKEGLSVPYDKIEVIR